MTCPVCNSPMIDIRAKKTNPKGPDYRCSDKSCKFSLNKKTGEYEGGEYTTAIWLPKPKPTAQTPQNQPTNAPQCDVKAQLIAVAGGIIEAMIRAGSKIEHPFKATTDGFKSLLMAYYEPFGKKELPRREPEPEIDYNPEGENNKAPF